MQVAASRKIALCSMPSRAEDEMGEGLVGDDLLAAVRSLRQVDGGGGVFGREVLVAGESEVDEQAGRQVAARRAAARRVDQPRGADQIVRQRAAHVRGTHRP